MKARLAMRLAGMMAVILTLASCAEVGQMPPAGEKAPASTTSVATLASVVARATPAGDALRRPAAAGRFYSDDPEKLAAQVDRLLAEAELASGVAMPVALVAPHAGYVYSGHVAAQAYRQIIGVDYDAIVVIGVNHQDASFRRVSVWAEGGFETPLGVAQVDEELAAALIAADERIVFDRQVHLQEHSVEVQLPFLQRVFGDDVRFAPVVIGEPSAENNGALAGALAETLSGKKALIVASADLSHYPAYDDAVSSDLAILQAIVAMDVQRLSDVRDELMAQGIPGLSTCTCGEGPLTAAILAAKALGANHARLLGYANSGDTPFGDRDQVVGYGAVMFWQGDESVEQPLTAQGPPVLSPVAPLGEGERSALLQLAHATLERYLTLGDAPVVQPEEPGLWQRRAAFVTLEKQGELRGCIGDLVGQRPLYLSVQWAALSAALADRRFPPVTAEELPEISVEISVLSALQEVSDVLEIEVGKHGLLIVQGDRRGVLLPQVAVDEGWDRQALLSALCQKAGLPEDAWQDEDSVLYSFTAEVFGDGAELRAQ